MTNIDKKILILVPASTARGGITNYYQVLKNEFSNNIEYFERGARTWPIRKKGGGELWRAWKDFTAFRKRLKSNDIILIQTSTSLGLNSILRDGLFVRYAKNKGIKTIVFIRGWNQSIIEKKESLYSYLLKFFFFCSDTILTLSEENKNKLNEWGYQGNIFVESTLVDKNLIKNTNLHTIKEKFDFINQSKIINLLYLSRIEKQKGIYELLKAYKTLKNDTSISFNVSLNIYGDGLELENVLYYIKKEKLKNIHYNGFVSKEEKIKAFEKAHIFIFPSYTEGMPNAVLEAMGFGLPILTTPVGGLIDFFISDKHGYYISIKNANDIFHKLKILFKNTDQLLSMAMNNYNLANKRFRSDIIAKRIESIFNQVIYS